MFVLIHLKWGLVDQLGTLRANYGVKSFGEENSTCYNITNCNIFTSSNNNTRATQRSRGHVTCPNWVNELSCEMYQGHFTLRWRSPPVMNSRGIPKFDWPRATLYGQESFDGEHCTWMKK